MHGCFLLLVSFLLASGLASAQAEKKTVPMTASARLAAATTVCVQNAGGNSIPFNVISSSLEGWGRYALVDNPAKADLIVEVLSADEGSGVTISSSRRPSTSGRTEQAASTTKSLSVTQIKLVVYDAKSKMALWSATEQPKFAFKQKSREDNLVEAAQRLVARFRERVEPTPEQ
jgi:hypothetical protein